MTIIESRPIQERLAGYTRAPGVQPCSPVKEGNSRFQIKWDRRAHHPIERDLQGSKCDIRYEGVTHAASDYADKYV
jgi:hypothetical protein